MSYKVGDEVLVLPNNLGEGRRLLFTNTGYVTVNIEEVRETYIMTTIHNQQYISRWSFKFTEITPLSNTMKILLGVK